MERSLGSQQLCLAHEPVSTGECTDKQDSPCSSRGCKGPATPPSFAWCISAQFGLAVARQGWSGVSRSAWGQKLGITVENESACQMHVLGFTAVLLGVGKQEC